MLSVVALGCGLIMGLAGAQLAAPLYWRVLASRSLGTGRATRLLLRAQRHMLARAGHHPYLVSCFEALEQAEDTASRDAAQARLRWWCAVRKASES